MQKCDRCGKLLLKSWLETVYKLQPVKQVITGNNNEDYYGFWPALQVEQVKK